MFINRCIYSQRVPRVIPERDDWAGKEIRNLKPGGGGQKEMRTQGLNTGAGDQYGATQRILSNSLLLLAWLLID